MTTPLAPVPTGSSATPGTPVPSTIEPPKSIAEANAAVTKLGATWDDVKIPGAVPEPPADGMAVTDGEPETPETPESTEGAGEAADGAEFIKGSDDRWHRADGTFATSEEVAQIEAQLAAEASAPEPEAPKPEHVVAIRRRDGSTREVIIEDPELADEIRANMNDGMRGREYREKVAALDARLAQFNKMDALLEKNPEAVVRESLSQEQRIRLGVMLLAEHFDDLIPAINEYYTNPGARVRDTAEAQQRIKQQSDEFTSYTAAQNAAAEVRKAVAALIPDDVEHDRAEAFWADASADVQRAMSRGERVDPSTVATLLASRIKLYGFAHPAGATPAASPPRIAVRPASPSNAAASPLAQPANDAAKALADAKAAQHRIKLRQTQRNNAAAVPPKGAGAAPVRLPAVAAGSSIQEASKAMRKLGGSWASFAGS